MKIISVHIENFGKLHDYTQEFQPGCNYIFAPNGWGKSTMATFLRVMLYGFEGEGKRNELENERKLFKPWQGGVYGGSMTFETEGKTYLVTRTFGEKQTRDTFELRDAQTNLISTDFSDKLGEELFQINSESFARTVFIGQSEQAMTQMGDGIRAKMGGLQDVQDDMLAFEGASERLKKFTDRLTPKRATGELSKMADRQTELKREIKNGESIERAVADTNQYLEQEKEKIQTLQEQRDALSAQQEELSRQKEVAARKEAYRQLVIDSRSKSAAAKSALEQFPNGLPEEGALDLLFGVQSEAEKYNQAMQANELLPEEASSLRKYEKYFADGVPEEHFYAECSSRIVELSRLKEQGAVLRVTAEEEEELSDLSEVFAEVSEPYENAMEEISTIRQMQQNKKEKEHLLASHRAELKAQEMILETEKKNQKSGAWKLTLVFAVLFVVAAIVTGVLFAQTANTALLKAAGATGAVAIVLLIVAFVLRSRSNKPSESLLAAQQETEKLREEIEQEADAITKAQTTIDAYLKKHTKEDGFAPEEIDDKLQNLLSDVMRYTALLDKKTRWEEADVDHKMATIGEELRNRFRRFGLENLMRMNLTPSAYQTNLDSLQRGALRYQDAVVKQEAYSKNKALYEEKLAVLYRGLTELGVSEQALEGNSITTLLLVLREREIRTRQLIEEAQQAKQRQADYEKEQSAYQLSEAMFTEESLYAPQEELPELTGLQQEYQTLQAEIEEAQEHLRMYRTRLEDYAEGQDEWEENKQKLEALEEELAVKTRQYELAMKANELLAKARASITARQTKPLTEGFTKYVKILEGKERDTYHIDADVNVTRDELGQQRKAEVFSEGNRDLIGVCKRLAVADMMYPTEKPPLIMDDPFTNFDDARTTGGKNLLEETSKEYQIIYFTCAASRM